MDRTLDKGHGRLESRTVKPHHRQPASGVPGLVSRLVGGVGVVSCSPRWSVLESPQPQPRRPSGKNDRSRIEADIAVKGTPAPIQAGKRWPVERTHSLDERIRQAAPVHRQTQDHVEFYLYLAAALTVIRHLINRARTHYRWPTRPTTRRLR
jgi:hypothetical protein